MRATFGSPDYSGMTKMKPPVGGFFVSMGQGRRQNLFAVSKMR